MQLHWNYGSTGLLVVAHSDVDKSNQSYYGESKLNYLTIDGTHEGLVPLRMFDLDFKFISSCSNFGHFINYSLKIAEPLSLTDITVSSHGSNVRVAYQV